MPLICARYCAHFFASRMKVGYTQRLLQQPKDRPRAPVKMYRCKKSGVVAVSKKVQECSPMPKRTFQPNRRHRAKTHGFLSRMKTKSGAAVLSRRRAKGRHKIAVSAGFRD